jgi:hypothetical protein
VSIQTFSYYRWVMIFLTRFFSLQLYLTLYNNKNQAVFHYVLHITFYGKKSLCTIKGEGVEEA